jgi:L-seryl-tRNA(Ser) seleniumtransferase
MRRRLWEDRPAMTSAPPGLERPATATATPLPYERGDILRSTADDLTKLERAWREIARRHTRGDLFDFTGLERRLPVGPEALPLMDDELAPALVLERVRTLGLEHLGGEPGRHDVLVCNRLTAALVASAAVLVAPGDTVVGLSAGYSHPAVRRAVALSGGRFVDTTSGAALEQALDTEPGVTLVVLTRLAVTYDLLPLDTLRGAVAAARRAGARILADDAGGARVGPAVFGQPRTLELGVDVGATGLDKYGTAGPRLGLLAGERALVAEIRARAFELGLEARPMLYPAVEATLERYDPGRVRALVACTDVVGDALASRLGTLVRRTPVSVQLRAEDLLAHAAERGGVATPALVPYEASAALAMLLLLEHGILTVHFAGIPPGTSAILLKFVQPETLERFGGAERFAECVESSLERLATIVGDRSQAQRLLLSG